MEFAFAQPRGGKAKIAYVFDVGLAGADEDFDVIACQILDGIRAHRRAGYALAVQREADNQKLSGIREGYRNRPATIKFNTLDPLANRIDRLGHGLVGDGHIRKRDCKTVRIVFCPIEYRIDRMHFPPSSAGGRKTMTS